MFTSFAIEKVNALRQAAQRARQVAADGPRGWSRSEVDPMRLLGVFPTLRLRRGFVLRAYLFRDKGQGNGALWAMPRDAAYPEPDHCPGLEGSSIQVPRPPQALDDYLDAVEGDGSPWSHLSFSLFAREAAEFGVRWRGASWSDHKILGGDPWTHALLRLPGKDADIQWTIPRPRTWEPCFKQEGPLAAVRFHTFTGLGRERVIRHCDFFQKGLRDFRSQWENIAQAGRETMGP